MNSVKIGSLPMLQLTTWPFMVKNNKIFPLIVDLIATSTQMVVVFKPTIKTSIIKDSTISANNHLTTTPSQMSKIENHLLQDNGE